MELQMTPSNRPRTVADMPWEGQADSMRRSGFSASEIEAKRKKFEKRKQNEYNKANGIKKPKSVPKEHDEQKALIKQSDGDWGKQLGIQYRLVGIPNSAPGSHTAAAYFRAEGLRRGYPDLALDIARGKFHGLRIELKRLEGGKEDDDDQRKWWDRLRNEGYAVVVCKGHKLAMLAIEAYLRGEVVE